MPTRRPWHPRHPRNPQHGRHLRRALGVGGGRRLPRPLAPRAPPWPALSGARRGLWPSPRRIGGRRPWRWHLGNGAAGVVGGQRDYDTAAPWAAVSSQCCTVGSSVESGLCCTVGSSVESVLHGGQQCRSRDDGCDRVDVCRCAQPSCSPARPQSASPRQHEPWRPRATGAPSSTWTTSGSSSSRAGPPLERRRGPAPTAARSAQRLCLGSQLPRRRRRGRHRGRAHP